jgi:hypothetical protein
MRVPAAGVGGARPRGDAIDAGSESIEAGPMASISVPAKPLAPPPLPPATAPRKTASANAPASASARRSPGAAIVAVVGVLFLAGFCVVGVLAIVAWQVLKTPEPALAKGPKVADKEPPKAPDNAAKDRKAADTPSKKDAAIKTGDGQPPANKDLSVGKNEAKDTANTGTKDQLETQRLIPEKEITDRVRRAGGKIGKVTVSLAWQNYNDLDLHVTTASGEKIFYGHRRSSCGGQLDVDQNVSPTTQTPVENIYWPADSPPRGPFKVFVHHYRNHGLPGCKDPTRFVVRVQIDDDVRVFESSVSFVGQPLAFVAEIPIPTTDKK